MWQSPLGPIPSSTVWMPLPALKQNSMFLLFLLPISTFLQPSYVHPESSLSVIIYFHHRKFINNKCIISIQTPSSTSTLFTLHPPITIFLFSFLCPSHFHWFSSQMETEETADVWILSKKERTGGIQLVRQHLYREWMFWFGTLLQINCNREGKSWKREVGIG